MAASGTIVRQRKAQMDTPADAGGYIEEVDGGYNPADFVIPASDHQGHSERIYCRVQPQHDRAISVLMKSGKFPFRTPGDFMRWSVVRGLQVCHYLDPMPGFLGAADAITEILRQEVYLQELTSMFQKMESVMATHVANGAHGEARKLLTTILTRVRAIDEPYWKRKCEEDVMKRFGHLLEGKAGAGRGKAGLHAEEE